MSAQSYLVLTLMSSFLFVHFSFARPDEKDIDTCKNITGNWPKGIYTRKVVIDGNQKQLCCLCPPGTYYERICTENQTDTTCTPCLFDNDNPNAQYFMDEKCPHSKKKCIKSKTCDNGYFRVPGNRTTDAKCIPHSKCPPGSGVTKLGSKEADTQCAPCDDGYQSLTISATERCRKISSSNTTLDETSTLTPISTSAVTTVFADSSTTSSSASSSSTNGIIMAVASVVGLVAVMLVVAVAVRGYRLRKKSLHHKRTMKEICTELKERVNELDLVNSMYRYFKDLNNLPTNISNIESVSDRFDKCFQELMKLEEDKFNPERLKTFFDNSNRGQFVDIITECIERNSSGLRDKHILCGCCVKVVSTTAVSATSQQQPGNSTGSNNRSDVPEASGTSTAASSGGELVARMSPEQSDIVAASNSEEMVDETSKLMGDATDGICNGVPASSTNGGSDRSPGDPNQPSVGSSAIDNRSAPGSAASGSMDAVDGRVTFGDSGSVELPDDQQREDDERIEMEERAGAETSQDSQENNDDESSV